MPINSRNKGKVGELEWAAKLREFGFGAERGQQRAGGTDSPDVRCSIPNVHFEVKRVEALNVGKAMEQAVRDGGPDNIPVIAHRKNRANWLVTMPAEEFLYMVKVMMNRDLWNWGYEDE